MVRVGTGNAFRRRSLPGPKLCVALFAWTIATSAWADTPSAGAAILKQARAAWERGSFEVAEPLYRDALEKGGLAPSEVLEGYVRLGSIRASSGKKESALAAFRAASVLDSSFTVPPEAGSKGVRIADKAKRDTARIGSIRLNIRVPRDITAGKSFKVTATIDKGHLRMLRKLALVSKDATTSKEVTVEAAPDEIVDFDVTSDVAAPGANLTLRVDALDAHDNRLASSEERVTIPGKESVAAGPPPPPSNSSSTASTKTGSTRQESNVLSSTNQPPPKEDGAVRSGGSFWSSPWPYIIGGIALAGAGSAVYFGTRPADNVSIGSVGAKPQ